jgi:hypothetical protein
MKPAQFLPAYLKTLDETPLDVLPMLAPDFTFSVLWADEGGAHEFTGSYDEYHGYLSQRQAEGQLHHLNVSTREGSTEVATGWTTRNGDPLGSFTFAVELDGEDRAKRLFAARTLVFAGNPF